MIVSLIKYLKIQKSKTEKLVTIDNSNIIPGLGEDSLLIFLCQNSATFVVLGKPRFRRSATDHIFGGNSGEFHVVCFVGLPLIRMSGLPKTYVSSKY